SPDTETLVMMKKKQNTRRSLQESIGKIYDAGIFVNAGFIVGFDTESGSIARGMIDCIEDTAIPVCMIGLLYALPNTQLTRRLARPAHCPADPPAPRAGGQGRPPLRLRRAELPGDGRPVHRRPQLRDEAAAARRSRRLPRGAAGGL